MAPAAADAAFAVVFSLFVVVTAVLIVLVLRFTLQRAAVARGRWLAEQQDLEDGDDEDRGFTALVLGGGGTRGAVQVGMLQVLAEHGFVPDRIYGSSVGALNGVAYACDPTVEGVERMSRIWAGLRREVVYPQGRLHGPWLYFQQRDSVYANSGLRAIMEEGFACERLEDAVVPVEVVATSLTTGQERWFTSGSAVDAVLASAAVPAIFPPVEIDGDRLVDGGVVNNVPIRRAIEAGATKVVVLLCSAPIYAPVPPRRPVEGMLNALMISIHARFVREMSQIPPGVEVILCVGSETAARDFDDFSSTEALITQGRDEASEIVRRYGLGTVPARIHEAASPQIVASSAADRAAGDQSPADQSPADQSPADQSPADPNPADPGPADPSPAQPSPAGQTVAAGGNGVRRPASDAGPPETSGPGDPPAPVAAPGAGELSAAGAPSSAETSTQPEPRS